MTTTIQATEEKKGGSEVPEVRHADCCVVGCGPAGALLGLLLARAGVNVIVLEKHEDFLRDFRGDTLHPSTMDILDGIGLADRLLQLPHAKTAEVQARVFGRTVTAADLHGLKTRFPYITMMPQWDFLNFLTEEAKRYPTFRLEMRAEAQGLVRDEGGVVRGVRYETPEGPREARATLTVAADGRSSVVRAEAGLLMVRTAPPADVLWFRIPRQESDPKDTFGVAGDGLFMAFINRNDYWQVAYGIAKGSFGQVREGGLAAFQRSIGEAVPEFAGRAEEELRDWEDVKLLSVQADRLKRWHRPGLLCIGDAAHAMSPIGGVGINYAIQDAVVAANVLAKPLRKGRVKERHLRSVQLRRELPTRAIQAIQSVAQSRVLAASLRPGGAPRIPAPLRYLLRFRAVRSLPPRLIAFGLWRVRVRTPELTKPR